MAQVTQASETIARTVRRTIESGGFTQEAVAEAAGIARVTFFRRLSGRSPFDVDELDRVATVLGVTLQDLTRDVA